VLGDDQQALEALFWRQSGLFGEATRVAPNGYSDVAVLLYRLCGDLVERDLPGAGAGGLA